MRFLIFLMLVVPIIGCGRYNKMTEKCRTTCKDIQKENVGARFMWRDIKLTFGKCTCVAKNGNVKKFYMNETE